MHNQSHASSILLRPSIAQTIKRWYRNINLLSIAYACRPRQVATNPERTSLPQETLGIRWTGFSPVFRSHTGILTSKRSTSPSGLTSLHLERSPLIPLVSIRSFGGVFSPVHFRRRVTRLVSYYALFKWWLLLSQHPSCLSNSTSFST